MIKSQHATVNSVAPPPLVTVAIPTFNRARLLRGCVAAALAQTYDNIEVVVSDNASSDETPQVLAEFDDRRLRVIRQMENIGAYPNWNACLAEARGEFVVVVSDDDRITPDFAEGCARLIGLGPTINLVVGIGDTYIPESNLTLRETASKSIATGVVDGIDVLQELLRGHITPQMCTIAMRTELLRSRGGFPGGWPHTGDLAAWVPFLFTGSVGFINEKCGTYCSHGGTQTAAMASSVRIGDVRRLTNLIVAEADRSIAEPHVKTVVVKQARRYLARNAIGLIAISRGSGVSLVETLRHISTTHRDLTAAVPADLMRLLRPITMILLPHRLTRLIRQAFEFSRRDRVRAAKNTNLWDHRAFKV
jgi:hypothetical protein